MLGQASEYKKTRAMVKQPISRICMMCLGINLALTCYANFLALQPEFEMIRGHDKKMFDIELK